MKSLPPHLQRSIRDTTKYPNRINQILQDLHTPRGQNVATTHQGCLDAHLLQLYALIVANKLCFSSRSPAHLRCRRPVWTFCPPSSSNIQADLNMRNLAVPPCTYTRKRNTLHTERQMSPKDVHQTPRRKGQRNPLLQKVVRIEILRLHHSKHCPCMFVLIVTMLEPSRSLEIKGDCEIHYVPPARRQLTRNAPI